MDLGVGGKRDATAWSYPNPDDPMTAKGKVHRPLDTIKRAVRMPSGWVTFTI